MNSSQHRHRLNHPLFFVIVLALTQFYSLIAHAETQQVFYVATDGSDSNTGTLASPFKTLEKARDAVRSVNTNMTGDIIVYLRGGNYEISAPLELTTADSGSNGYQVIYKAYDDEVPVLNGATRVTDWTVHDGNIYKATLDHTNKLRTLIVNDERAYMASTTARPNSDWGTYTITAGQADWARISGTEADGAAYNLSDIPTLSNPSDVEIMNQTTWNTNFITVRDSVIDGSERILKFSQPYAAIAQNQNWGAFRNSGTHTLLNAYEFLDEANEFYFDRANQTLYYYADGVDMTTAEVYAPRLQTLLNISGNSVADKVSDIVFDGITFANTEATLPQVGGSAGKATVQAATWKMAYSDGNWHNDKYTAYDVMPGAINVNNAEGISIQNGTVKHIGNEGINFTNDVVDSQIIGNAIVDIGGSGINIAHPQHVYIGDGGEYEKYPVDKEGVVQNILVKNNLLYDTTRIYFGHAAITGFFTDGLEILHNQIQNTKYSGVSLGWGWNNFAVETLPDNPTTVARNNKFNNNRVYNVMTYLHDGGAFYTLGSQPNSEANGNYVKAPTTYFQGVYHPDEGTAYYTGNDLVFEIVPGQDNFELNAWRDKRDNHYDNIYSTSGAYQIGAPNSTITNLTVVPDADWPAEALDIIDNAGIEDEYAYLLDGIPDAPDVPGLVDASGYTQIEAESGNLLGSGSIYSDSNASGGAGVENIHTDGSGIEFTNMPAATSLYLSYASKNTGSYSVYVDGEHAININFTATGGWSGTYTNSEVISVNIPEGATLTLKKDSDDAGINIDYISVTNQSLTQQAEDGTLLGSAKVSNEHAGYMGTGFVGDMFNVSDSVQITVNAIEGGQYIMRTRYAMGLYGPSGDRTLSVYVNGTDQVQSVFTTTGEWNIWDETEVLVTLLPGNNDIKLQLDSDDTGVVNLDQIVLNKVYEAEEATLVGTTSDNTYEGFSGFGYVSNIEDINDAVVFNVEVPIGGEYTIDMVYALQSDAPDLDHSLSIYVNEEYSAKTTFIPTSAWDSWSVQTDPITLAAGNNTIAYQLDADDTGLVNLDYMLLNLVSGSTNEDDEEVEVTGAYEAEDAAINGHRIGIGSEHDGFHGTGYVEDFITEGDTVEFTVEVETAGQYLVDMRYAMGTFGPAGNRTLSVYVNDVDVLQSSFATTVEWNAWSNQTELLTLHAGTNTIRYQLDADDTGWINMDYITLDFDSAAPILGDLDGDEDVDVNDVAAFYQGIRTQEITDLSFDFNNDGVLSSRDVRGFMALCTRANCAAE
ncbi:CBM35 domain-containing protein [Alteromonas sp. 14N.309.X.WAT.G.H12]|uniref:CBM35 domain-containing protein n=1 Tax=Alteromonas sp. 14N.309.X.WAT.G.H12 TaxID=3120824 RepID=UPI002FCEFBAB